MSDQAKQPAKSVTVMLMEATAKTILDCLDGKSDVIRFDKLSPIEAMAFRVTAEQISKVFDKPKPEPAQPLEAIAKSYSLTRNTQWEHPDKGLVASASISDVRTSQDSRTWKWWKRSGHYAGWGRTDMASTVAECADSPGGWSRICAEHGVSSAVPYSGYALEVRLLSKLTPGDARFKFLPHRFGVGNTAKAPSPVIVDRVEAVMSLAQKERWDEAEKVVKSW